MRKDKMLIQYLVIVVCTNAFDQEYIAQEVLDKKI